MRELIDSKEPTEQNGAAVGESGSRRVTQRFWSAHVSLPVS